MVIQSMDYDYVKRGLPDYSLVKNRNFSRFIVVVPFSFFLANNSFAGEITFTPSLGIKESYSDNILLAPKGQEQSESVTEISPAFTFKTRGSHFNASVNYSMQNLLYKNENSRNQTYNKLAATSTSELLDDYFYFDLNANHSQQIINPDQPIGLNHIAITNNTSDVSSYSMAPYIRHSFHNIADILLKYSYSNVDYRRDELIDVTQSGVNLDLASPSKTPGYSWGLKYLQQKSDYVTGNDSEFIRGSLQLGYRFTSRMHVYASKGKDENMFTVANNRDISSSFWNAGFDWQPDSRDSVTLQYGERFFGHTAQFGWRHSAKRLTLNAHYEEELSTSALSLLQSQQFSNASINSSSQQNQAIDQANPINSRVFVKELASVGLIYKISKTSFSLNYSNDKRIYQDTGDITEANSAHLSISLRSSPILTYVFRTSWNSTHTASTDIKTSNTNLNFSVHRQLAASLQAEFSVSHGLHRSTNTATNYDENIVSLGITKTFN